MAPIIASAEVSRSPEDVFAYVTDPSHLAEWQESVVSVKTDESALDDGARSRVTIELDFEGHGIGKLLVPLVVRRQAQKELPNNALRLKERLESGAT